MIRRILRTAGVAAVLSLPRAGHAAPNPLDYAWVMNRGAQVPMQTVLLDESGHGLSLAEAGAGKPVILDIGYFHCPTLCGVVRADLMAALKASGSVENKDYALVSVSIDPAETPKDAAEAKAADLAQSPFATGAGWHYLTGSVAAVSAVKSVVGFRDSYDEQLRQFIHPAGVVVLTQAGLVSAYMQGVGYSGGDLRTALLRASRGEIGEAASPILLLCFHFDAATGRYTLEIEKVLRLAAGVTVLAIGGLVLALRRRRFATDPRH